MQAICLHTRMKLRHFYDKTHFCISMSSVTWTTFLAPHYLVCPQRLWIDSTTRAVLHRLAVACPASSLKRAKGTDGEIAAQFYATQTICLSSNLVRVLMEDYQAQGMGCTTKWDSCIQRASSSKTSDTFQLSPANIELNALYRASYPVLSRACWNWLLLRYPTKCSVSRCSGVGYSQRYKVAALGTLPYIQIFEDKDSVRSFVPGFAKHYYPQLRLLAWTSKLTIPVQSATQAGLWDDCRL